MAIRCNPLNAHSKKNRHAILLDNMTIGGRFNVNLGDLLHVTGEHVSNTTLSLLTLKAGNGQPVVRYQHPEFPLFRLYPLH